MSSIDIFETGHLNCNVKQPDSFKPKNDEQDIEKMRPLFNAFDELDYKFNKYSDKAINDIQSSRDHNTALFYEYHRVPQNGENWATLARWRYQNEEIYKRFMFWRFCKN
ncbi:hypothetical protein ACQWTT_001214 [Acinetobacter baumannii]